MTRAMDEAVAFAIAALVAREPSALLVAGPKDGFGPAPATVASDRVIEVPGSSVRLSVAFGAAAVGRTVVVRSDDASDALALPWRQAGRLVVLTGSLRVATVAWEAGAGVLMPGWPADIAPLLADAADAGSPRCVYVHDGEVPAAPPMAVDPLGADGTRMLMHGGEPVLAAGADRIVSLLEAAWQRARSGRPVTTVQLVRLGPDGPSPVEVAGSVFVSSGETWRPLAADSTDPQAVGVAIERVIGVRGDL